MKGVQLFIFYLPFTSSWPRFRAPLCRRAVIFSVVPDCSCRCSGRDDRLASISQWLKAPPYSLLFVLHGGKWHTWRLAVALATYENHNYTQLVLTTFFAKKPSSFLKITTKAISFLPRSYIFHIGPPTNVDVDTKNKKLAINIDLTNLILGVGY